MCAKLPIGAMPTLPAPLSLTPTLPAMPTINVPKPCCRLPPIPVPPLPIPIPSLVLIPGVIETLNAYIKSATTYVDLLPVTCPVE